MRLGFVGIGRMGEPMVYRLLEAEFEVIVWNRTHGKLPAVISAGAEAATQLSEVTQLADIILTIVTDDAAVDAVYLGAGGLLSVPLGGKLFADMSTILPSTTKLVAA